MTTRSILVTGGTGTFGRAFIRRALAGSVRVAHERPDAGALWDRVISYSRDEVKASAMHDEFGHYGAFRAFLGDVRDRDRLAHAFRGVDTVVHAAALKRVDVAAYSPSEIYETNITGTMNVVTEAIEAGVRRVVVISSDKAVAPTNIYGASKYCAECYAVQANNYGHNSGTCVAAVRYGNVLASRGSVVHIWRRQLLQGRPLTVTSPQMTRFIMTIEQAVDLVLHAMAETRGGEVFVPLLPSARMIDLAQAVHDHANLSEGGALGYTVTGLRPGGEKMAEALLNEEEPSRTRRVDGHYVVLPSHHDWTERHWWQDHGSAVDPAFTYRSDVNDRWLTPGDLRQLLSVTEALQ
jgi:UDP-N-acetylglucosamine 4,6-dehydratase